VALDLAGKAKMIFNRISQDMKEKELYEKVYEDMEENYLESLDSIAEEVSKEPKQTTLPLLLKEYKLKRQISDLKDSALDTLIEHHKEVRSLKTENDFLKGVVDSNVLIANNGIEKEYEAAREVKLPTVTEAIGKFKKLKLEAMKLRTRQKYETSLNMLAVFHGDKSMSDANQFQMNKMFSKVERLPPDWKRNPKFKSMTITQVIEQNKGEGLHLESFGGYKSPISQFVKWAKKAYDGAFDGVIIADIEYDGGRRKGEDGQRSFNNPELIKLFACKEMKSYCGSGKSVGRFWLPVIGLYTGMRVNEICQLNPFTDILNEDGIWYFLISSETDGADDIDKSVKSGTSRKVPIHSKLIELGLFGYTDALKKAGYRRMFPLDAAHKNGASGNTARGFRRFIETVGLRDEGVNNRIVGMHAFRHTIITKAYKEGFIKNILPVIGHEDKVRDEEGIMLAKQTVGYIDADAMKNSLLDKKEAIEKVVFDIEFYKPVKPIFR